MLTCTQKSGAKEGNSSLHSSMKCPNTAVLQTTSAPKSPLPASEQEHFRAELYCTQFYICPRVQQNHRVGVHWQCSSLSSQYHLHSPSAIPSAGHPNLTRPFKELSNDLIFLMMSNGTANTEVNHILLGTIQFLLQTIEMAGHVNQSSFHASHLRVRSYYCNSCFSSLNEARNQNAFLKSSEKWL